MCGIVASSCSSALCGQQLHASAVRPRGNCGPSRQPAAPLTSTGPPPLAGSRGPQHCQLCLRDRLGHEGPSWRGLDAPLGHGHCLALHLGRLRQHLRGGRCPGAAGGAPGSSLGGSGTSMCAWCLLAGLALLLGVGQGCQQGLFALGELGLGAGAAWGLLLLDLAAAQVEGNLGRGAGGGLG